jgi:hypothetical protein
VAILDARRRISQAVDSAARRPLTDPLVWGLATAGVLISVALAGALLTDLANAMSSPLLAAIAGATGLGLVLSIYPLYGAVSVPGYVLGRAGVGRSGLLLFVGALVTPVAIALAVAVTSLPPSTSPPFVLLLNTYLITSLSLSLLIPFAIGHWRGRRARRRAIAEVSPAP